MPADSAEWRENRGQEGGNSAAFRRNRADKNSFENMYYNRKEKFKHGQCARTTDTFSLF